MILVSGIFKKGSDEYLLHDQMFLQTVVSAVDRFGII